MNEPLRNEIVERWRGGQSQRGIARDLRASRWTVARVIVEHQTQPGETPPPSVARAQRTGLPTEYEEKLDPIPPRPPAAYQPLWIEGTSDEPTTPPPEVEHAEESAAEPPAGDSDARPPAGDSDAGPAVAP